MPDYFCNSFETKFSTTRFFSKILGLGGLRQLPNSPKGRAGPGFMLLLFFLSFCCYICEKYLFFTLLSFGYLET